MSLQRSVMLRVAVVSLILRAPVLAVEPHDEDRPRSIAEVRRMPGEAIAESPVVTVRGTVTRVGGRQQSCILQDDTDGIYVGLDGPDGVTWRAAGEGAAIPVPLEPGLLLEVRGRLEAGGFSPTLMATHVCVVGPGPLPEPRPADAVRFFHGAFDCTVVEVRGIVQAVLRYGRSWRITIGAFGRPLMADVAVAAVDGDPRDLVDAEVRVVGPTVSIFNTRGEFLMPWVTVNQVGGFTVVIPPPQPAFESPMVPLTTVAGFQPDAAAGHRVRTAGTVIHATPAGRVYLLEGTVGISVMTKPPAEVGPGDQVEVAGFIDRSTPVARITHAVVRRLVAGPPPPPVEVAPAAILAANAAAAVSASKASPGDYEGCLVRFRARLLDTQPRTDDGLLTLATDDATVSARVAAADLDSLRRIAPGSDLLVTGIVELEWDFNPVVWPPRTPRSLGLLVRSAEDVTVLRAASWWTPARLGTLLGVIAAVLVTTLGWVWWLRREVARQRTRVVAEMRRRQAADAAARERELRAEQRRREELQVKLETSLTAAAAAHDIKLPLSNILLGTRMADEMLAPAGPAVAFVRPVLADIAAESQRVVDTIERMRMLLRNVQTEHGSIDVVNVVHNALLYADSFLRDREVDLRTVGLDAVVLIDGDAAQLQNAVVNLLHNAADAVADMPPDQRHIHVEVRSVEPDETTDRPVVDIVVGDSGLGIPETVLASLPLHTTKPQGTGLGLFIVRTTAANHGGRVSFDRSPLGGAAVRIRLPRPDAR